MTTDWLRDAVIYEIYPQSFADSDGDGIGDLRGVIEHLDHLSWLGIDTMWFNPCFDSPFVDAGYDVADSLRIAPRYGSNSEYPNPSSSPVTGQTFGCAVNEPFSLPPKSSGPTVSNPPSST